MLSRLLRSPAAQTCFAVATAAYLRFALRTTRWTLYGREHLAPIAGEAPGVVAFWHERLPLMPALWAETRAMNPARRVHVLVSRHRDGRFIGAVVGRFAMELVHGSSARPGKANGGSSGLRAMLAALRERELVAITPDGPRGPRRVAAAGVAQLAGLSGAPVLAAAAQTSRRIVLGTWDRMVLPLPFGRGAIVFLPPIAVARERWQEALPRITAALDEAADRADALCR